MEAIKYGATGMPEPDRTGLAHSMGKREPKAHQTPFVLCRVLNREESRDEFG